MGQIYFALHLYIALNIKRHQSIAHISLHLCRNQDNADKDLYYVQVNRDY